MTQTHILADIIDGSAEPNGVIYIVRNEETIFYIGMTRSGIANRLDQHVGEGLLTASRLGQLIRLNRPESDGWQVEVWDQEDCAAFIQPLYPEWADRWDVEAVEERLIFERKPCLNYTHNPNPRPLPSRYNKWPKVANAGVKGF